MKQNIIFRANNLPIQQNRVFDTADEALKCSTGNVLLVQDEKTGIVHNTSFDPNIMSYDKNYQNEQAYSMVFQSHLELVRETIERHFLNMNLVEIGCGKGKFLELLQLHGFSIMGVDPAYEGNSPFVIKEYFSPRLNIKADAIILRHVLEHIPKPLDFLASLAATNDYHGLVYIEVPCLDWISEHRAWFDIFYEHVNYFRLSDFHRIFQKIIESGHFFNGQYLYIIADLSTLNLKNNLSQPETFSLPKGFFDGLDKFISTEFSDKTNRNKSKVIWGAGSKGALFALHVSRKSGINFDFAIDINPAKQNKYLPVTGLPVVSPSDCLPYLALGSTIYVMNSNYYEEIKSGGGEKFNYYRVDHNEF